MAAQGSLAEQGTCPGLSPGAHAVLRASGGAKGAWKEGAVAAAGCPCPGACLSTCLLSSRGTGGTKAAQVLQGLGWGQGASQAWIP